MQPQCVSATSFRDSCREGTDNLVTAVLAELVDKLMLRHMRAHCVVHSSCNRKNHISVHQK